MIYDLLNELEESDELEEKVENYGVTPLSYVALNCAR